MLDQIPIRKNLGFLGEIVNKSQNSSSYNGAYYNNKRYFEKLQKEKNNLKRREKNHVSS